MRVPPTPTMPGAAGLWRKSVDWSSRPGDRVAFHIKPVVGFSASCTANRVLCAMSPVLPLSASVYVTSFFPSVAIVVVIPVGGGVVFIVGVATGGVAAGWVHPLTNSNKTSIIPMQRSPGMNRA